MADLIRRNALFITSVMLLIVSFQLMSLSVQNRNLAKIGGHVVYFFLSPIEHVYSTSRNSLGSAWNRYIWLVGVEEARTELAERVKQLEAQNSRLMESKQENQRLRMHLDFMEETQHRGVVAAVVGHGSSNWVKTVSVNRGTDAGIKPGLAVVDGNAVVGQVIDCWEGGSKVLLLTDATSAIDVILQRTRASGIVEGRTHGDSLKLRYVEKLADYPVNVGDRIISSGLDGVFPKGTLVGVISDVRMVKSSLFYDIDVLPSVNVHRLETVMILLPKESAG